MFLLFIFIHIRVSDGDVTTLENDVKSSEIVPFFFLFPTPLPQP